MKTGLEEMMKNCLYETDLWVFQTKYLSEYDLHDGIDDDLEDQMKKQQVTIFVLVLWPEFDAEEKMIDQRVELDTHPKPFSRLKYKTRMLMTKMYEHWIEWQEPCERLRHPKTGLKEQPTSLDFVVSKKLSMLTDSMADLCHPHHQEMEEE